MKLQLSANRDKPVRYGHPWIFSGALSGKTDLPAGIVGVYSAAGELLGEGFYNPGARLAVRMLTRAGEPPFTTDTVHRRIAAALSRRKTLLDSANNAVRLIFAESDFLPGLVADQYGKIVSLQFNSAFAERFRDTVLESLREQLNPDRIIDTSDPEARDRDGLRAQAAPIDKPAETEIVSNGIRYSVSVGEGQKTGFYLDQRENRAIVASAAAGRRVLDAFCYSGAFGVSCLSAGAKSVYAVDSSADALLKLEKNLLLNELSAAAEKQVEVVRADVFEELRRLSAIGKKFDLIVLDPPKLAPSRGKLDAAEKAYKDLNLQGLKLAAPGALLATFTCSGAMSFEKLRQVLHYAAHDAGRKVQIIRHLAQAEDHPVALAFPESEYLRGYLCRIL